MRALLVIASATMQRITSNTLAQIAYGHCIPVARVFAVGGAA